MGYFWTNTVWFLLLGIITVLEIIFVLARSKNRARVFAFYLSVCGAAFLFEMILFAFLKAYDYYPMIVDNVSRLDDGLAGNLFSQFSVSATALLICELDLKFYWQTALAFVYGAIEELFLYLGVYRHNWYQTWITVAGLIVLFGIVKAAYKKFAGGRPAPLFKYILVYFAAFVPHTDLISWPFRLIWGPTFSEKLFADPQNSAFLLFAINFNILCITAIILRYNKAKWRQTGLAALFLYAVYFAAHMFDLVVYRDAALTALFATAEIAGIFLSVFLVDKLYGFNENRPAQQAS